MFYVNVSWKLILNNLKKAGTAACVIQNRYLVIYKEKGYLIIHRDDISRLRILSNKK